jgi:hypothetical protein
MAWANWLGAGLQAVGALNQGKMAQQSAEYNAQLNDISTGVRERAILRAYDQTRGTTRTNIAKSGVTTSGTPMAVIAESAANAELDLLNNRVFGQLESGRLRRGGEYARSASKLQAGAALLTEVGRTYA